VQDVESFDCPYAPPNLIHQFCTSCFEDSLTSPEIWGNGCSPAQNARGVLLNSSKDLAKLIRTSSSPFFSIGAWPSFLSRLARRRGGRTIKSGGKGPAGRRPAASPAPTEEWGKGEKGHPHRKTRWGCPAGPAAAAPAARPAAAPAAAALTGSRGEEPPLRETGRPARPVLRFALSPDPEGRSAEVRGAGRGGAGGG